MTAIGMAAGVLIIALSYAASRGSQPWASPAFWTGEVILYGVPAVAILKPGRFRLRDGQVIALLVPITSYVVEQSYSLGRLLFLDEFEHVRTAQAILRTHHLFHPNVSLAVSPQYPGLEIVTAAISSMAHLPIDVSASVIMGVLHCLLGVGVFLLVQEVTHQPRWAALSVLIYAAEPHFQFFDSYFIYQNMAFPFMLGSLLATLRMIRASGRWDWIAWGAVALACAAVTVVSHHVTSYALLGMLAALEVGQVLVGRGRSPRLLGLLVTIAGVTLVWDLGIATATVGYFAGFVRGITSGLGGQHGGGASPPPRGPIVDTVAEYLGIVVLCGLVAVALGRLWHARHRIVWGVRLGMGVGALGVYLAIAAGVVVPGGGQLWGRAATFVMLPGAMLAAWAVLRLGGWLAVVWPWSGHLRSRWGWRLFGLLAVVCLAVGGIAGGWPPWYARLPGPYLAGAWERSVDAHEVSLATWASERLSADNGVAAGYVTASILGSLGRQSNVGSVPSLFSIKKGTAAQVKLVRLRRITFIVVDLRDAQLLPADGFYFSGAQLPTKDPKPLARSALTGFASVPGLSRVFDDGTLIVYDVTGSAYAPPRKSS